MAGSIVSPLNNPNFGYVVLASVANMAVHQVYMSLQVGKARKKYKIAYPLLYATGDSTDAKTFNCIQRGQQNSLENQPSHLISTVLLGFKYPVFAAVTSLVVTLGRVLYFKGYSTGEPKKRFKGQIWAFGQLTQFIGLVVVAVNLLRG